MSGGGGVPIELLVHDDLCQTREAVSQEHVDDLIAALDAGAILPPLDVVELPDGGLCVVDGFHRLAAHLSFGSSKVPVRTVSKGTLDDARRVALGANSEPRGLRRSSADKRRAVTLALTHPHSAAWSDSKIAELCAVDRGTVSRVRAAASPVAEARVEAAKKAAAVVASKPEASSREVAAEAGVSRKAARTALAAAKRPQEAPNPPDDDELVPAPRAPTAAMVAKAASLPAGAPDPMPLLDALRQMDALRRSIGPMLASGLYRSSAQDFDAGWDRARACIAFAVPVPCAHHEGPECQWCGGDGWYSTSRSKAVEPQHAAMLSIRGER